MSEAQFALAWDEYKKNICSGLSTLQQNGEFVDMTLAADGHFVKVHQVILALASPYIKELISSANCPHPVIFLNKISNTTLCSILEYIYTGEVLVTVEDFDKFIEAATELHIKGLENMKSTKMISKPQSFYTFQNTQTTTVGDTDEQVCYFEVTDEKLDDHTMDFGNDTLVQDTKDLKMVRDTYQDEMAENTVGYDVRLIDPETMNQHTNKSLQSIDTNNIGMMQYTVSNQGSLQMILNRFLYYLKHTNQNNTRQWRCVDYVSNVKCPAHVVTKGDMVVQRISAHTHPFHDKKILKKVRDGAIFSAIQEAEHEGTEKRKKLEEERKRSQQPLPE